MGRMDLSPIGNTTDDVDLAADRLAALNATAPEGLSCEEHGNGWRVYFNLTPIAELRRGLSGRVLIEHFAGGRIELAANDFVSAAARVVGGVL